MHEGGIAAEGRPGEVLTSENLARIYRIRPHADHSWSRM
jgi:ABC-type cobalamin/Fe3+-siderophores transport system ATPase subunit